jgi:hypothetical protein
MIILFACATENQLGNAADPVPSPYLVEDTGTGAIATLSPEEVSEGVRSTVAEVLAMDPAFIFDAQTTALAGADSDCPYIYDDYIDLYGYYYWYDTCDTESGGSFDGYSYYNLIRNVDYGSYVYNNYGYFYGLSDVSTPKGERFEQTGYAYYYDVDYVDSGYRYNAWDIQGDFIWTGDTYGDTWLGQDISMVFSGSAYRYGYGGALISMNGTIGGLDGAFDAVSFTDLFAINETAGGTCNEPGGTISIRDTAGEWYDVEFQGPAYWGAENFPPLCDGCGDIYNRGVYLGQACPDLSGLLDWKGRPWD